MIYHKIYLYHQLQSAHSLNHFNRPNTQTHIHFPLIHSQAVSTSGCKNLIKSSSVTVHQESSPSQQWLPGSDFQPLHNHLHNNEEHWNENHGCNRVCKTKIQQSLRHLCRFTSAAVQPPPHPHPNIATLLKIKTRPQLLLPLCVHALRN